MALFFPLLVFQESDLILQYAPVAIAFIFFLDDVVNFSLCIDGDVDYLPNAAATLRR